jgi:hypothetical protein
MVSDDLLTFVAVRMYVRTWVEKGLLGFVGERTPELTTVVSAVLFCTGVDTDVGVKTPPAVPTAVLRMQAVPTVRDGTVVNSVFEFGSVIGVVVVSGNKAEARPTKG